MTLINYFNNRPIHLAILITNLIPIIILITRRDNSKPLRVFLYYLIVSFVVNLFTDILSSQRINNILYNNMWILTSLVLTMLMFYYIFLDEKRKSFIIISCLCYTLIFFWELIHFNKDFFDLHNHKFVLYSMPIRSGVIILMCLMFYYELIKELYIDNLLKSAIFWIVSGLFLYHSATLFCGVIFQHQHVWNSTPFYRSITRMPLYFEVVMFIIVSIGLIKSPRYVE